MLFLAVAAYAATLVVTIQARGLPLLLKRALRVIAVYGAIAYLLRGWYLATYEPVPTYDNPIPIVPLFEFGYRRGVTRILFIEAGALLATYAGAWVGGRYRRHPWAGNRTSPDPLSPRDRRGLVVAYGLGTLIRVLELPHMRSAAAGTSNATFTSSPLMALTLVPSMALVFLMLQRSWWEPGSSSRRLLYVFSAGEVVWGMATSSKQPIIALVVLLYLTMPDWNKRDVVRRQSRKLRLTLSAAAAVALLLFSLISASRNPPKAFFSAGTHPSLATLVETELEHPTSFVLETVTRVGARLDGLTAASQTMLPPREQFLPWSTYVSSIVTAPFPTSVFHLAKMSEGQMWANRYEHVTYHVSLAQPVSAEGYAMGGVTLALVWSLLLGLLLARGTRAVDRSRSSGRRRLAGTIALAMIASPALIEQGYLTVWDSLIGTAELSILILFLLYLQPARSGRIAMAMAHPPPERRRR